MDADVVIAGAGPAGSTAAALLARVGLRVVVIDKDAFPRFHIGESLLPGCVPVIEELELTIDDAVFVPKAGADFVHEATGRAQRFEFADALPGCPPSAWHVERSGFDTALRDRAMSCGADVHHGERVEQVDFSRPDRVEVQTDARRLAARFFVDATGQDHLLAKAHAVLAPISHLGRAAVFTHFADLSDDALATIGPGGHVRIVLRDDGWGWVIPLPGRRVSIGVVGRQRVQRAMLDEGLLADPLCRRLTSAATRCETHAIRNFSYRNRTPHGPRFAAIGDAGGFLDPLFSSGVTLAMRGASLLAKTLAPALAEDREADPALCARHEEAMDRAYRTFGALIDRFYHTRIADTLLLRPHDDGPMRRGMMTVLAGDVWRDDNPFQDMLLRARPRGGSASTRVVTPESR